MLKFISYNYEISYNNKIYLQVKDCPMGTHFSPPFAIIFMNYIEAKAIKILENKYKIQPKIFKRYIDDIILGPLPRDNEAIFSNILNTFNSINKNIQFTIEVPKDSGLNFLDMTIYIENNQIQYKWYSKPNHSGICLRKDSWLPHHIKDNFVGNSRRYVSERCSNPNEEVAALDIMNKRLSENGFKPYQNNRKIKPLDKPPNWINLSLDFVSDSCNRKMNKLKRKYGLPMRITARPGKRLQNTIKSKIDNKDFCQCDICKQIGPKYNCNDKYLVYEFSCKICQIKYIGQSSRPFRSRYNEHERSVRNRDKKSALSDHHLKHHRNDGH